MTSFCHRWKTLLFSNSLFECNEVVSAFWSFYRRCFLLLFLFFCFVLFCFFKLFCHLLFQVSSFFHTNTVELLWFQFWTKSWIACFTCIFNSTETSFLPLSQLHFFFAFTFLWASRKNRSYLYCHWWLSKRCDRLSTNIVRHCHFTMLKCST